MKRNFSFQIFTIFMFDEFLILINESPIKTADLYRIVTYLNQMI